jgi:hypothetical protein
MAQAKATIASLEILTYPLFMITFISSYVKRHQIRKELSPVRDCRRCTKVLLGGPEQNGNFCRNCEYQTRAEVLTETGVCMLSSWK